MAADKPVVRDLDDFFARCCDDHACGIVVQILGSGADNGARPQPDLDAAPWVALASELYQSSLVLRARHAEAAHFAHNYEWVRRVTLALYNAVPSLFQLWAIPAIAFCEASYGEAAPKPLLDFIASLHFDVGADTSPLNVKSLNGVIAFVAKSSRAYGETIVSYLGNLAWIAEGTERSSSGDAPGVSVRGLFPEESARPLVYLMSSDFVGRLFVVPEYEQTFPKRLPLSAVLRLPKLLYGMDAHKNVNFYPTWWHAIAVRFGYHALLVADVARLATPTVIETDFGNSYAHALSFIDANDVEFADIEPAERAPIIARLAATGKYGYPARVCDNLVRHYVWRGNGYDPSTPDLAYFWIEQILQVAKDLPGSGNIVFKRLLTYMTESAIDVGSLDGTPTGAVDTLKLWAKAARRATGLDIFNTGMIASVIGEGENNAIELTPIEAVGRMDLLSVEQYKQLFRYLLSKQHSIEPPRANVVNDMWMADAVVAWNAIDAVIRRNYTASEAVSQLFRGV